MLSQILTQHGTYRKIIYSNAISCNEIPQFPLKKLTYLHQAIKKIIDSWLISVLQFTQMYTHILRYIIRICVYIVKKGLTLVIINLYSSVNQLLDNFFR